MNEKLTKKRVLELCLDLWTWLRDNPMKRKSLWPGWEEHQAYLNCFACEYVQQQQQERRLLECSLCPLLSLWTKSKNKEDVDDYPCSKSYTSPYEKWLNTDSARMRAKYAGKIVDFCRKELEREHV